MAQALPALTAERVLILYGDVPLIETATLERLLEQVGAEQLGLLTVDLIDPTDERWASALERVQHDVYDTPASAAAASVYGFTLPSAKVCAKLLLAP